MHPITYGALRTNDMAVQYLARICIHHTTLNTTGELLLPSFSLLDPLNADTTHNLRSRRRHCIAPSTTAAASSSDDKRLLRRQQGTPVSPCNSSPLPQSSPCRPLPRIQLLCVAGGFAPAKSDHWGHWSYRTLHLHEVSLIHFLVHISSLDLVGGLLAMVGRGGLAARWRCAANGRGGVVGAGDEGEVGMEEIRIGSERKKFYDAP